MEIRYHCSMKGKKFYKVRRSAGKEIFLGTMGECKRFIKVHKEKVSKHLSKNHLIAEDKFDILGNKI